MNRRNFLVASASAAATLVPTTSSQARTAERLKVLIPTIPSEQVSELREAAPGAELIECRNENDAVARVGDAVASFGFISPRLIRAGKKLRWVQQPSAGVEHLMEIPELTEGDIVLTNMQRAYAPEIADQALGYLLAFSRDLGYFIHSQADRRWPSRRKEVVLDELAGKTLLIIGLGGIGSEIARRAFGFGMRVLATDPKVQERPLFVEELHRPEAFHGLIPRADVVASAVPLTKQSRKMIGAEELGMMKAGVVLINVSRRRSGRYRSPGLGPGQAARRRCRARCDRPGAAAEGPPSLVAQRDHHSAYSRSVSRRVTAGHELFRENLRRFAAGEMLLNVVDKKVGY